MTGLSNVVEDPPAVPVLWLVASASYLDYSKGYIVQQKIFLSLPDLTVSINCPPPVKVNLFSSEQPESSAELMSKLF